MGIRFHCPNGHKLNVKSFLAGKKGVCPDCGVKLRIPDRSEAGLDSGIDEAKQAAAATSAAAAAPAQPVLQPAVQPISRPVQPVISPQQPAFAPQSPAYNQQAMAVGYAPQSPAPMQPQYSPMAPGLPAAPPGLASDPIAENPLATWFVRPPSGGQFGPARGEVMRKWLTEGRVTADSLVWREGWVDWLAATEVFPSLGKPAAAVGGFSLSNVAPKTTSVILPTTPKKDNSTVAILIALVMACLILVVVLALVISGQISLPGINSST